MSATYDGIKAFEMNASYNSLSNVSDTLREDIEAAISTFMQSLSMTMGIGGYNKNHMIDYIPAILFTLYDGYYIYSPAKTETGNYEYMLKPYNYYTVRYKQNDLNDIVINYTLDNYIVVYGWINGKYTVKQGYLVSDFKSVKSSETLHERVPFANINNEIKRPELKEVTSILYVPDIEKYKAVTGTEIRNEYLYPRNDVFYIDPTSAQKYYNESRNFSNWVKNNLGWVTPSMAMRNNEYLRNNHEEFENNTRKIFVVNTTDNNPEDSTSIFAEHKTNIIKYSIQDNLNQAITAYSQGSAKSYEYKLPMLDVNEWDMVSSNICMLTFMQGVPMGTKYYNNYALVQSTTNSLYVSPDSLYFISDKNGDGVGDDGYYHKIDCPNLGLDNINGYSNFDFLLKKMSLKDEAEDSYYMHEEKACYYCIVDSNYTPVDWEKDARYENRRQAYYTALAREKHRRYTATDHLEYQE